VFFDISVKTKYNINTTKLDIAIMIPFPQFISLFLNSFYL